MPEEIQNSEILRSMINNLKVSARKRASSREAIYYMRYIKESTGRSFQNILSELVVAAVKHKAETDEEYMELVSSFASANKTVTK